MCSASLVFSCVFLLGYLYFVLLSNIHCVLFYHQYSHPLKPKLTLLTLIVRPPKAKWSIFLAFSPSYNPLASLLSGLPLHPYLQPHNRLPISGRMYTFLSGSYSSVLFSSPGRLCCRSVCFQFHSYILLPADSLQHLAIRINF